MSTVIITIADTADGGIVVDTQTEQDRAPNTSRAIVVASRLIGLLPLEKALSTETPTEVLQ